MKNKPADESEEGKEWAENKGPHHGSFDGAVMSVSQDEWEEPKAAE